MFTSYITKVKPNIIPVGVHPQLSHKGLPMDGGGLVAGGSHIHSGSCLELDNFHHFSDTRMMFKSLWLLFAT
jgi:hypothetical protein